MSIRSRRRIISEAKRRVETKMRRREADQWMAAWKFKMEQTRANSEFYRSLHKHPMPEQPEPEEVTPAKWWKLWAKPREGANTENRKCQA